MSILIYQGYKNQHVELKALKKYTGKISSVGKINKNPFHEFSIYGQSIFYFKVGGLDQTFGFKRRYDNFSDLEDLIVIGDAVTVYFQEQEPQYINVDLVQIEKKDRVILDRKIYLQKQYALILIGIIGFIIFGFSLYRIFRTAFAQIRSSYS